MVARPAPAPVPGSLADRPDRRAGPPPACAADVWTLLSRIPDPEIPVISITDLGIVRNVRLDGAHVAVEITPTYSGCPATSVIGIAVEAALTGAGLTPTVTTRIDPPWTTDWLTGAAHEKLRRYGIAPPGPRGAVACPRCGSAAVREVSRFGSTPCKAQWACDACAEPFDRFKCH